MLLDIGHELVGVLLHVEEISLLAGLLHGTAAVGAFATLGLGLGEEGLAGHAVPALVTVLINVALVIEALEHLLHGGLVVVVGGADEVVVLDVHLVPEGLDLPCHAVHVRLGGHARGLCKILDLLTVLVSTRAEKHVVPHLPLVTGDSIGHNGLVGVAEMRLFGRIRDGGGDIELGLLLIHGCVPFYRNPWRHYSILSLSAQGIFP